MENATNNLNVFNPLLPLQSTTFYCILVGPINKKPYDMIQGGNEHVNVTTETIMVPDKMVGLIIGRGGEQITRLQVRDIKSFFETKTLEKSIMTS